MGGPLIPLILARVETAATEEGPVLGFPWVAVRDRKHSHHVRTEGSEVDAVPVEGNLRNGSTGSLLYLDLLLLLHDEAKHLNLHSVQQFTAITLVNQSSFGSKHQESL